MKNIFNFIFICAIAFSIASCSSDEKKSPIENDSSITTNETPIVNPQKQTIQTDSGRLEIEAALASGESKATLFDPQGKILETGLFINNKPAGAWLKYDAKGNVISAEHYEEGKPTLVLDKNDFDFTVWENKQLGAKFSVPKNWKELPSANPALVASFEKEITDTTFKPNFNIARAKLDPGDNIEKLEKMQSDMLHQNFSHVVPVEENNLTIDSCSASRSYGTYYDGKNNVGFLNVIIVSGQDAWFFSCAALNNHSDFLYYQGVFEKIVESFQRTR